MRALLFFSLMLTVLLGCHSKNHLESPPFLKKEGSVTRLMVDGSPFLIRGGELGNSTATTIESMNSVWPLLQEMNLNTVLVPVYWELIEPEEGVFEFGLYKNLITEARKRDLKIVFLWFGSWKNSMSSHAPSWIKLDPERFPRAMDEQGRSQEILSPFGANNLASDRRAFGKLMDFIRDFDRFEHTVIMMQVENETAMLPSARDYSPLADSAFRSLVPAAFMEYLDENESILAPELRNAWKEYGRRTNGVWEEVFGKNLFTDEIFMAWHFSEYTEEIIKTGKDIYPLPMFVNAALNRPGKLPGSGYPSAGPLPHLMDVWKAAGPSIDFFAPDIYFPDFRHWCDLYIRNENPLFIPEHRFDETAPAKALFAVGHYHSLGFSPFSIESSGTDLKNQLGKAYSVLQQLSPLILSNQGHGRVAGAMLSRTEQDTVIRMGKYEFICKHDHTLGWSSGAREENWPIVSAILIQTGEDEFYFGGSGVVITPGLRDQDEGKAGILKAEDGNFVDEKWNIYRHLNGDQTHQGRHLRIPEGEYGIQRFSLYTYK